MDLKEIGVNARYRVDSVQDRDYWRAHVNAREELTKIMKIRFCLRF